MELDMISFRILMTCQFLGHQLPFQVLFPTRLSLSGENPGNEVAGTLPMSSRIQMIHIYNIDCSLKSEKKWPKMAIRSGIYSELLSDIFAFNQEREIFVQAVGLKTSNWLQCLIFNN